MKNRETKERFTPLEFHNRYASVILGRDAWGPTLRVSVKKPGRYEISVTSEGYSTPVLREEMEFKGLDREQVIRLLFHWQMQRGPYRQAAFLLRLTGIQ